jgi:hypothetical protein
MLSVPCGLPTYVGAWPPVRPDGEVLPPFADLAASTPHSACACGGGAMYGRRAARSDGTEAPSRDVGPGDT